MTRQTSCLMGLALAAATFVMTSNVGAEANSQRISEGEQIYAEKHCSFCHLIQGKGGRSGPDLSKVGAQRDTKWLKTFMKDPKALVPKAKMPPFAGSADQLEALVAYLSALK